MSHHWHSMIGQRWFVPSPNPHDCIQTSAGSEQQSNKKSILFCRGLPSAPTVPPQCAASPNPRPRYPHLLYKFPYHLCSQTCPGPPLCGNVWWCDVRDAFNLTRDANFVSSCDHSTLSFWTSETKPLVNLEPDKQHMQKGAFGMYRSSDLFPLARGQILILAANCCSCAGMQPVFVLCLMCNHLLRSLVLHKANRGDLQRD